MPANGRTPADQPETTEMQRLVEALALAERDRQLLGYEIHDGVVQELSAAAMYLEGAGREAQFASAEAQEKFVSGLRLLREAIASTRQLIRGTVSVELDERGLASALERLAERFRADHGMPIDFSASEGAPALSASVQHLLLRIAQEALYNVWKHAHAKHVQLKLAATDKHVELSINDDGVGFDFQHIPAGHFGIAGIRARARILGADLHIDSRPGHGTRITVRLPKP
jgi:signal transduction histidine kinase